MTETEVTPQDWSAALRSGEYDQVKVTLRGPDGAEGRRRCCALGVLCDLVDPDGWTPITPAERTYKWGTSSDEDPIQPFMSEWISPNQRNRLVRLNDVKGLSFPEIADWIDEGMPTGDDDD